MSNSTGNSPNFKIANTSTGTFPGVTRTELGSAPHTWSPQAARIVAPEAPTEPIEWAKFCMWLRGYLRAVEGRELTAKDSATIMEKLATVDPDSQLIKVYDNPPQGRGIPPLQFPITPGYSTTCGTGANANQNNSTWRSNVDGDL